MTAEIFARALLMLGAFALMIGPGLQARMEVREYHELLDVLNQHDLPPETREYLRLLAVGPSLALLSPLGGIRFLLGPSDWYPLYRAARRAFRESTAPVDERVVQIRTHLTRARNWSIVVLGSVLIFSGATIELIHTIVSGAGE